MRTERHLNGSTKSQNTAHPSKAPFSEGSGMRGLDHKALARKLSDALLQVRPLGGSELFMRVGEEFYADPAVCGREIEEIRRQLHSARAETVLLRRREKAAIDALTAIERARNTDTPKDWERATQLSEAALSLSGAPHV